jgi:hypothetical protein
MPVCATCGHSELWHIEPERNRQGRITVPGWCLGGEDEVCLCTAYVPPEETPHA